MSSPRTYFTPRARVFQAWRRWLKVDAASHGISGPLQTGTYRITIGHALSGHASLIVLARKARGSAASNTQCRFRADICFTSDISHIIHDYAFQDDGG